MEKLILNHSIGSNCTEFLNGPLDSYFFKLTLGSHCLAHCFWIVDFKNHPDSVILQKCRLFSIQGFKHNSTHMSSLDLTPNLFLNVYYTKGKRLQFLDSLSYYKIKKLHCRINFSTMGKTTSTVDFKQISNVMESSAKIINGKKTLTIFAKHSTTDI